MTHILTKMNLLINNLCLKRLCLPSNIDISMLYNGQIKSIVCNCNNSHHIACVLNEKDGRKIIKSKTNIVKHKILAYGINKYTSQQINLSTHIQTIHAEIDAINNLIFLKKKSKKLKKINILVIRTNSIGKIGMSKPCLKCIIEMSILSKKKGYKIKNILFSDQNEQIQSITLKKILNEQDYYISKYDKKNNRYNEYIKKIINIKSNLL